MVQPHLINYVREQMKAGYAPEEVRSFLVGHGYPIRDIDEALMHARRLAVKPAPQMHRREVSLPQPSPLKAKLEEMRKKENFVELFKTWFMALFMPAHVFPEEKKNATISRAFMNVLIASSLGGVIAGVIMVVKVLVYPLATPFEGIGFFGLAPFSAVQTITITPLVAIFAWLPITAFFYLFSLLTGGTGTFGKFAHFTSLIAAPLSFLLAFLSVILPGCINFFTFIVLGAIGLYPMIYAVKEAHNIEIGKAAIGTFVPVMIFVVLMIPVLLRFTSLFALVCTL